MDLNYARNVIVEVPHPIFDINTPEEGSDIFQGLAARALFIAGTHRCANPDTQSGCSGRPRPVVAGPFRFGFRMRLTSPAISCMRGIARLCSSILSRSR